MMSSNGDWAWMWIGGVWMILLPVIVLMWALIAMVFLPWARNGRPEHRPASPREQLDGRLASGEISVEEHRTRRSELEQRA